MVRVLSVDQRVQGQKQLRYAKCRAANSLPFSPATWPQSFISAVLVSVANSDMNPELPAPPRGVRIPPE